MHVSFATVPLKLANSQTYSHCWSCVCVLHHRSAVPAQTASCWNLSSGGTRLQQLVVWHMWGMLAAITSL